MFLSDYETKVDLYKTRIKSISRRRAKKSQLYPTTILTTLHKREIRANRRDRKWKFMDCKDCNLILHILSKQPPSFGPAESSLRLLFLIRYARRLNNSGRERHHSSRVPRPTSLSQRVACVLQTAHIFSVPGWRWLCNAIVSHSDQTLLANRYPSTIWKPSATLIPPKLSLSLSLARSLSLWWLLKYHVLDKA
jgi:hypothetical protein